MLYLFLIAYMAVTSRLSGSGFGKKWGVSWAPELAFALPFGITLGWAAFHVVSWLSAPYAVPGYVLIVSIIAAIYFGIRGVAWAYGWMQAGHGIILEWGGLRKPDSDPDRKQTLTPVVNWLADRLGIQKTHDDIMNSPTINYCRLFMAVKGFLIGLPAGGIVLAVLWPLGYEIGHRTRGTVIERWINNHTIKELSAGAGAGVALSLFIVAVLFFLA